MSNKISVRTLKLVSGWSLVIGCLCFGILQAWDLQKVFSGHLEQADFADQPEILSHLSAEHSPLRWWTGSWVLGPRLNYYRPIPSTIWWGLNAMHLPLGAWMALHWILHALTALLLFSFLRRLVSFNLASITMAIWAVNAAPWLGLPGFEDTLLRWKDAVEPLVSAAILLSCGAYLSWLRTGRHYYYWGALLALVVGCLTKEVAFIVPLLAALLIWREKRLAVWRSLLPLCGVVIGVLILRTLFLHGMGSSFGTNDALLARSLVAFGGGRAAFVLMSRDVAPLAFGMVLVIPFAWKRWRLPALLLVPAVLLVTALGDYSSQSSWGETLLRLLPGGMSAAFMRDGVATFLLGAIWWHFLAERNGDQVFAALLFGVLYLPLVTAPNFGHVFYLPSAATALWLAVPIRDVLRWLVKQYPAFGVVPSSEFAAEVPR